MTQKTFKQTEYSKKLLDPKWQKKRLEILNRDEFLCQQCSDHESTLHVHHIAYTGCNPWDTPNNLLITLCDNCHKYEEQELKNTTYELIQRLKSIGFRSMGFHGLIDVFDTDTDRGFSGYEPAFDILKWCIEDDEIWEMASNRFWTDLRAKAEKRRSKTQVNSEKSFDDFRDIFGD